MQLFYENVANAKQTEKSGSAGDIHRVWCWNIFYNMFLIIF